MSTPANDSAPVCQQCLGRKTFPSDESDYAEDCPTCHGTGHAPAHPNLGQIGMKLGLDAPAPAVEAAITDTQRLDWLCDYVTNKGYRGFVKINWSVYDEDGESLMERKAVREDEVDAICFDRAAIDAAMKGTP